MIASSADIHRFFRRLIVAYAVFAVTMVAVLIRTLTASWAVTVGCVVAFAAVMTVMAVGLARRLELPLFPPGRGSNRGT